MFWMQKETHKQLQLKYGLLEKTSGVFRYKIHNKEILEQKWATQLSCQKKGRYCANATKQPTYSMPNGT